MVKHEKSLLIVLIMALLTVNNLYSQSNANKNDSVKTETASQNITNTSNVNNYFTDDESLNNNQSEGLGSVSTIGVFIRMIVVLLIIIVMIYGVLYFIKKKTNLVKEEDDFLRRAAYLNIAPGKTVEVITLIDKAYLIGVTEDNISLLGEITDKELIQAMNLNADKNQNVKRPSTFDDVLQLFMGGKNTNKNVFTESENKINDIFNKR